MTIKTLTIEQVYDPGFTLVCGFDADKLEFYTREKDGVITIIQRENWGADRKEAAIVKDIRMGGMATLWQLMDDIATGEQFRRGWREKL